ncbi:hypothetical protein [Floridanema evergladense]|uniref:Uncharacterized protein n=1 Tax=Floridaenema evergladense BLCC-F167 TaxID=3153639 RepID=A0ABV4WGS6_9CYAN
MSQDQPKQPEVSTQDTIPAAVSLPPETAMPVPSPLTDTLPAAELTVPSPLTDTLSAAELTVPSPLTDTLSAAELTVPSPLTDTLPAATTPAPASTATTTAKAAPVAQPSLFSKIWGVWKAILTKVRQILPESVRQKLPNDTVLTGAIALLLILILWVNSLLSPGKPAQVAEVPPTIPSAPSEVTTPPEVAVVPEETPVPEIPVPSEIITTSETPVFTPVPEDEKVASGIKAPLELTETQPPQPIENLPPPPPVLTPEQTLIAAIQNQVADIAGGFADGLIVGIKADFPNNFLSLQVANDWYTFDSAKQDLLAADMWRRSQELNFDKLEISDTQGRLIARSPVIGSNMIIWQRKLAGLS